MNMIKLSRENITDCFSKYKFLRPIFFTTILNKKCVYGDSELNKEMIKKNNRHFLDYSHRKLYEKSKKKILRLIVIEKGTSRKHCHMILDVPEHISETNFHN